MTKGDESGSVVGFRPGTCIPVLIQNGATLYSHPFIETHLAKIPAFGALPGDWPKTSYEMAHSA